MRQSGVRQPSVRSNNRMVAKGIEKNGYEASLFSSRFLDLTTHKKIVVYFYLSN